MNAVVAADAPSVQRAVFGEFFWLLGLPDGSPLRRVLQVALGPAVRRFAALAADFDQRVARHGLPLAIRPYVPRFTKRFSVTGAEGIPPDGPLLVVSNHPGAVDLFAILVNLPRDDIRIIVSEISIIRHLPATAPHFISIGRTADSRMAAVRQGVKHLHAGGVLFIFPGGIVDPDPAFMPGAAEALARWSPSLELLVRRTPETHIVVTIVGGVLSPGWWRSPVTRLRSERKDRQKVAEVCQVAQQMVFPGSLRLSPQVAFAPPFTIAALAAAPGAAPSSALLPAVQAYARALLARYPSNQD